MISNASELLWCRTCGTRLATYIRATTPDRVRLQHGWRRRQAKAVRVDTQLWGGRRDLARQALQGKQFLTCSWAQRNPIGARGGLQRPQRPIGGRFGEIGPVWFFDDNPEARQYAHSARDDFEEHSL